MNITIKTFLLLLSIILFSSCCTNVSKEKTDSSSNQKILSTPTTVAINKSKVTAKIKEILTNSSGSFVVKAFISEVQEEPAYPSMAMSGKSYTLIPNFVLGEDKKNISDSEKNKNLMLLSKKKPGDEFEAIIFFENLSGWFIQEVISN